MKPESPVRRPPARPASRRFLGLPASMQLYVAGVIAVGAAVAGHATLHFPAERAPLFLLLLLAAGAAAAVRVALPVTGSASTLSLSFVVNFIALLSLGPFAVVPVAATSAWSQCALGSRARNPLHQTLFSIAALALTSSASAWAYAGVVASVPGTGAAEVGAALVAATVYFLFNTMLVATAVALGSGSSVLGVWARDFLWSGPTYYIGALIAVLAVTAAGQGSPILAAVLLAPAYVSYRSYRAYLDRIADEHARVRDTADLQLAVVNTLALAIEARDCTSQHHLQRMQVYAEGLAREVGLPEPEVRGVRTAALLHDIGTLAVPEHILSKPGLLTASELERVRIHARVGADILAPVPFPYPVASLVLAHHERWDGRGYPNGLAGEQIPVGARILAVVDCFTTMLADRPHRKAGSFADAIAAVRENSGSALDPYLVDTLLRILPHLESEASGSLPAAGPAAAGQAPAAMALSDIAVAHHEEQMLFQIAQALGGTLRVADVGALISTHLARLLTFTSSAVFLWDDATGRHVCEHATGTEQDALRAVTAPSLTDLRAAVSGSAGRRTRGRPGPVESRLVAPVELEGRTIGALVFCHPDAGAYSADHERIVSRVAAHAAPILTSAMLFSRAQQQSLTDPLTGLANRRFVEEQLHRELSRAQRQGSRLSVLFFDVDRFKGINDIWGHRAGDEALSGVGRFLQSSLRDYDVCARFGGDEFVVVLVDCDRGNAEARLRLLQEGIAGLVFEPAPGRTLTLTLSGGAATYPADGDRAEALIAAADRRMYEDKSARKRSSEAVPA